MDQAGFYSSSKMSADYTMKWDDSRHVHDEQAWCEERLLDATLREAFGAANQILFEYPDRVVDARVSLMNGQIWLETYYSEPALPIAKSKGCAAIPVLPGECRTRIVKGWKTMAIATDQLADPDQGDEGEIKL